MTAKFELASPFRPAGDQPQAIEQLVQGFRDGKDGQVQVYDGGADGDADTPGDNTLFLSQGVFVP